MRKQRPPNTFRVRPGVAWIAVVVLLLCLVLLFADHSSSESSAVLQQRLVLEGRPSQDAGLRLTDRAVEALHRRQRQTRQRFNAVPDGVDGLLDADTLGVTELQRDAPALRPAAVFAAFPATGRAGEGDAERDDLQPISRAFGSASERAGAAVATGAGAAAPAAAADAAAAAASDPLVLELAGSIPAGWEPSELYHHGQAEGRVRAKAAWHHGCVSSWRTFLNHPIYSQDSALPLPQACLTRRGPWRAHAVAVFQAFQTFMPGGRFGHFPVANASFYAGPWIEDRWIARFAKPVLRRVTQAHMHELGGSELESVGAVTVKLEVRVPKGWAARIARMSVEELITAPWRAAPEEPQGTLRVPQFGGGAASVAEETESLFLLEEPYDLELFHPWVPLFVPWENMMQHLYAQNTPLRRTPEFLTELRTTLRTALRYDGQYVTVAQRSAGPYVLHSATITEFLRNVLVLSAGGHGQVPIPLLGAEKKLLPEELRTRPLASAPFALSFLGTLHLGVRTTMAKGVAVWQRAQPRYLRKGVASRSSGVVRAGAASSDNPALAAPAGAHSGAAIGALSEAPGGLAGSPNSPSVDPLPDVVHSVEPLPVRYSALVSTVGTDEWAPIMADTALQLAPRGTGPTSFRFYEALQLGLIPVYVYDGDAPWVPYAPQGGPWTPPFPFSPSTVPATSALPHGAQPSAVLYLNSTAAGARPTLAWQNLAHFVSVAEFPGWLADTLPGLIEDEGRAQIMRAAIAAARDSYFTYDGVLAHIEGLLRDPSSAALTCTLPHQSYAFKGSPRTNAYTGPL